MIILTNPLYPHNVAQTVRAASCYGVEEVVITGDRVSLNPGDYGKGERRMPREERMRRRQHVQLWRSTRPITEAVDAGFTPVAVEVTGTEILPWFEFPEHPAFVFGPEDGSIDPGILSVCHRFLSIPTMACLNLASSVAVVLSHQHTAQVRAGHAPLALREEEMS